MLNSGLGHDNLMFAVLPPLIIDVVLGCSPAAAARGDPVSGSACSPRLSCSSVRNCWPTRPWPPWCS
jgi:hypothetical protein